MPTRAEEGRLKGNMKFWTLKLSINRLVVLLFHLCAIYMWILTERYINLNYTTSAILWRRRFCLHLKSLHFYVQRSESCTKRFRRYTNPIHSNMQQTFGSYATTRRIADRNNFKQESVLYALVQWNWKKRMAKNVTCDSFNSWLFVYFSSVKITRLMSSTHQHFHTFLILSFGLIYTHLVNIYISSLRLFLLSTSILKRCNGRKWPQVALSYKCVTNIQYKSWPDIPVTRHPRPCKW